jgi:hypothetical protein
VGLLIVIECFRHFTKCRLGPGGFPQTLAITGISKFLKKIANPSHGKIVNSQDVNIYFNYLNI